jgi:hypothetical protein
MQCEGVLVHLMENKQARKTSSATMIEWKDRSVGQTPFWSFGYQDFGYREMEMSKTPHRSPGVVKSRILKSRKRHINKEFHIPGVNFISEFRIPGN